ncbi:MAG: alpha-amylase family glycosyl hydrolase [Candidatus Oleimicrobiaceae bacterium]
MNKLAPRRKDSSVQSLWGCATWLLLLIVVDALAVLSGCGRRYGPRHVPYVHATRATHWHEGLDWRDEVIYFVLIDRFCDGDSTNNHGRVPASHRRWDGHPAHVEQLKTYQGGDLSGVLDRLDYLRDLGVTAIWLSPVYDNSDSSFMGWWPYHGYQPVDFFSVDEHFGTLQLLGDLVDEAHRRGMKVILDIVCNHVAPDHPWVKKYQNWHRRGYKHWFHPHSGKDASSSINNWQDQAQLETHELHGFPDLAQENPRVYEFLLDMSKYWIEKTRCDGFRLDAVKHIPKEFWRRYCSDIHRFAGPDFLLLGEVFDGRIDYLAEYATLGFNALFDIPLYYTINRVFAQGGSASLLSAHLRTNQARLGSMLLSPLIDNHDVARFSYWAGEGAKEKLSLALTFLLTHEGLPMLYYGTEVALEGGPPVDPVAGRSQDYLNRMMMPWERVWGKDTAMVAYCRTLLALRRQWPALRRGATVELYVDHGVYCYLRALPNEQVLVVLNTSRYQEERLVPLHGTLLAGRQQLVEQRTGHAWPVVGDSLRLTMAPQQAYLFRVTTPGDPSSPAPLPKHCPFTDRLTKDFRMVRFSYRALQPLASVAVAGDFNAWSPNIHFMQAEDSSLQVWTAFIPLREGRYHYKFVIDGSQWTHDPSAPEQERDPYGGLNSVIVVR